MRSIPTSVRILSFLLLPPILVFVQNAPVKVACPKNLIRSAGPVFHQSLSAEEAAYVSTRSEEVLPGAWKDYLGSLGIALSGGGLRAAYFAAGVLTSLDGRNKTHPTGTNGVFQAATYLAGLSGGGWFTTALIQANFPPVPELVFPTIDPNEPASNSRFGGFMTGVDLLLPSGATGNNTGYFEAVEAELSEKHAAGFPVPITDAWSREVARHFVNGTTASNILEEGTHGTGILFSGIQNVGSHSQPFPIILENAIPPALTANPNDTKELSDIIPGNDVPVGSEIWEVNLFETGSWDPSLGSFIPTRLLGSTPASGSGPSKREANCVVGFDQASYIAGISSNVWNGDNCQYSSFEIFTKFVFDQIPIYSPILQLIEAEFPGQAPVRMDAGAVPNPFQGRHQSSARRQLDTGTFSASEESFIALVDGGSNGEVCPLQPLLVRARGVDTIFAIDAPADRTDSFSNGTDLITTGSRAARFGGLYPFPKVPSSPDTFVNQGLTSCPTFFGCDEPDVPLVIYLANRAPSAKRRALGLPGITNIPTALNWCAQAFMDESFAIATQGLGNNSTDPGTQWSTCLACALVDCTRSRQHIARDGICVICFTNLRWDGKE
ncbi:lysophospholipase [Flammula alnicola]|nr:lysophospholipase [Flammula alnicola]